MTEEKNIVQLPDLDALKQEASEWLMRLGDDDASQADIAAFYAWRSASDQHRAVFDRMAGLWGDYDFLEKLPDYAAAAHRGERDVRPWWRWRAPRRSFFMAAAASVACMVGAGVIYEVGGFGSRYQGAFETAIGEQRRIELRDGSVVELNTGSKIEVAYGKVTRIIRLIEGEAYFDVAPNPERPFSVYANNGVVTAVGTEFSVRLRDRAVDVLVAEGKVVLASRPSAASASALDGGVRQSQETQLAQLTIGHRAVFDEKVEVIDEVGASALSRKLSWRDGMLSFAGEPLSEVVADVSRYTNVDIDVEGEALRGLPVRGYFKIGEVDAMVEALEQLLGVRADYVGPERRRIILSKDT